LIDPVFQSTVLTRIGTTAMWRGTMAERYPSDLRNGRAADRLKEFTTASPTTAPDELWAALEQHDRASLRNRIPELARRVCFSWFPNNLVEFLEGLQQKTPSGKQN
jgi:hypothetical protein